MTVHERMKATDFPQELLDMFDGYVHGQVSKRDFLEGLGKFTVGGLTGVALLKVLQPDYALAQQVKADDPRITVQRIQYPSPRGNGTVTAVLAKPVNASGKLPGVVVVHENRGLNPYIEDVARRLAVAGFVALAPDGLSPVGGYPGDDDKARDLWGKVEPAKMTEDFFAAYEFLAGNPLTTGKVGCVGFCYGGGICNALAVAYPALGASVPFYGRQPPAADVAKIKAPLLIHYGELDTNVNAGWPAYETALKAGGKTYQAYIYPKANHGFHNDTTPRYDEAAATLAWQRTLDFFKANLN